MYWRDIPAQVIAKQRRRQAKLPLTDRFTAAIDAAAMRSGLAGTDAYLAQWRRAPQRCGADLEAEAAAAAARLEQTYSKDRLQALVRNAGMEPDGGAAGD